MTRHLLKLVWNRKRLNALLMVEIFISFLVVFAVATSALFLWNNYRQPLGFRHENLWDVQVNVDRDMRLDAAPPEEVEAFARLLREMETLPDVVVAAAADDVPYDGSTSNYVNEIDGRELMFQVSLVSDRFAEVAGIQVTAGRWFDESDSVQPWEPLVVSEGLARELFGDADPIGKNPPFQVGRKDARIIGVVPVYRKGGEFTTAVPYAFRRISLEGGEGPAPRHLLLQMRPGTAQAVEEEIVRRLHALAPDYTFEARLLSESRDLNHRLTLAPVMAGGVVAGFLITMVGLGLVGVLWQNITQRTQEIGLRRAAGASGAMVRRQILGEVIILTTLGLGVAVVLLVQLPILDLVGFLPGPVFVSGMIVAIAVIYGVALASGAYPAWLATRVQPAEALHYE